MITQVVGAVESPCPRPAFRPLKRSGTHDFRGSLAHRIGVEQKVVPNRRNTGRIDRKGDAWRPRAAALARVSEESAPRSGVPTTVAKAQRGFNENGRPIGPAVLVEAGEGIRTLDIHLGKVTLYH